MQRQYKKITFVVDRKQEPTARRYVGSLIDELFVVPYDDARVDYRVAKVLLLLEYVKSRPERDACLLLLDVDTYVARDTNLDLLFDMLYTYDVAVAREVAASFIVHMNVPSREIYRQFNTGVVAMRLTDRIREFCDKWHTAFDLKPAVPGTDQLEFTRLLFMMKIAVYVLPDSWNCRCDLKLVQRGQVPQVPWGRPLSLRYNVLNATVAETEPCLIAHCYHAARLIMDVDIMRRYYNSTTGQY
jgi:hypothetical protein